MVCHGCTFTTCMGMDCPELANTTILIQAATTTLTIYNKNKGEN